MSSVQWWPSCLGLNLLSMKYISHEFVLSNINQSVVQIAYLDLAILLPFGAPYQLILVNLKQNPV